MEDLFDLECQYQLYLKRMSLSENKIHPQQKFETKRAFFGACGQMLMVLKDDLPKLSNEDAFDKLDGMINQVGQFFINENHRQN